MSAAALRIVDGVTPVFDDGTTAWTLPVTSSYLLFGGIGGTLPNGTDAAFSFDIAPGVVSLGDFVVPGFSQDMQGLVCVSYVDKADSITTEIRNDTGGTVVVSCALSFLIMKAF